MTDAPTKPKKERKLALRQQLLESFSKAVGMEIQYTGASGKELLRPEALRAIKEIDRLIIHIKEGLFTQEQLVKAFDILATKQLSNPMPWLVITFGIMKDISDEPTPDSDTTDRNPRPRFDPESFSPPPAYPKTGRMAQSSTSEYLRARLLDIAHRTGFSYNSSVATGH